MLDRCYSPPWDVDDGPSAPFTDLGPGARSRTHFAPVATPFDEESLEPASPPAGDAIGIRFDDDDETLDPRAFADPAPDCIRVPPAGLSPPLVGHSDFNVIEEPVDRGQVDWWNYFEPDDDCPEVADSTTGHDGSPVSVSKGPSSPIAPDSFWRVPKSSAIPNSDWYSASLPRLEPVKTRLLPFQFVG